MVAVAIYRSEHPLRGAGGGGLVHFSATRRISVPKALAENMDLSPYIRSAARGNYEHTL